MTRSCWENIPSCKFIVFPDCSCPFLLIQKGFLVDFLFLKIIVACYNPPHPQMVQNAAAGFLNILNWTDFVILVLFLLFVTFSFMCYLDRFIAILMQLVCAEMHLHSFSYEPEQCFYHLASPWHEVGSFCCSLGQDVAEWSACKSVLPCLLWSLSINKLPLQVLLFTNHWFVKGTLTNLKIAIRVAEIFIFFITVWFWRLLQHNICERKKL